MHGRVQTVRHVPHPLFARIPERFDIVRYHSLAVTDLPPELQPLGWTDDGVLMAVAHVERPQWGVQFHPESVRARYGEQIVRNFCRLAAEHDRRAGITVAGSMPRPDAPRAGESQSDGPRSGESRSGEPREVAPVRRFGLRWRELERTGDTESLFCTLYGDSPHAVWLDSNDPGSAASELSLMGDVSGELGRWARADVGAGRVESWEAASGRTSIEQAGFFDWIERDLAAIELVEDGEGPPFDARPGWFGHLGYELKAECGGTAAHRARLPDAAMLFVDRLLVTDHRSDRLYALALFAPDSRASLHAASAWLDALEKTLAGPEALTDVEPAGALPAGRNLELRHTPREYADRIEECQRQIARGESYEICLTNELSFELDGAGDGAGAGAGAGAGDGTRDELAMYRRLRRSNPTSFSSFVRWPEFAVLGFSPERFLRVGTDRVAESRPMKGTRRRSSDPGKDRRLREDLASNEKDRSENLMIVDLVRNDLGRCAGIDGVRPEPLFEVESYATVHQLVSTVRATLRPEVSTVRCVRAAFPGGSMTGAPKVRTMRIIDRLEGGARGIYSGAIGHFGVNGAADLGIVIRTLVIAGSRVTLGTGGAIIALSDPREELAETALKARALLEPFGLRFPEPGRDDPSRASPPSRRPVVEPST